MTSNITLLSRHALQSAALYAMVAAPLCAQDSNPPSVEDPYYAAGIPLSGAYFDPENPGLSMVVDLRPDGSAFVMLGTYDVNGKPIWYAMQDRFDPTPAYPPTPEPQFHVAPSIGQVSGPVYLADGGSCIECPPMLPDITPADLVGPPGADSATLTWTSSSRVEVALGDTQWSMVRLPLDGPLASRITGSWQVIGWDDQYPSLQARTLDSNVSINAVDAPVITEDQNPLQIGPPLPINATHWFRVTCSSGCEPDEYGHGFWMGDSRVDRDPETTRIATFLWLDESSGKGGIEQFIEPIVRPPCSICPVPPQPVFAQAFRYSFELIVTDDGLIARRAQQATSMAGVGPTPVSGSIIRLQKLRSFPR